MKKYNIDTIVLHFGYVESSSLATIVAVNMEKSFETEETAIADLAKDLLLQYKDGFMRSVKLNKCCLKAKEKSGNEFCNKCGKNLNDSFDAEAFKLWLLQLLSFDVDTFGYNPELTWEIGRSPMELLNKSEKEVICIDQNAEKILIESLGLEIE